MKQKIENVAYDYFVFLGLLILLSIYWAKIGFPGKYGALGIKRFLEWTEVWQIFPNLFFCDVVLAFALVLFKFLADLNNS
ncbi:hypothetical protein [Leptospira sp. B5-022]|uniref:hypothetical protein n=1 Tax=Leptospira sp. B5-022 TaxID=1242992 RepID=UPI0002BEC596|nr:hypothetical protein [Leptospira sp. B5-022]EMJ99114.1 hypothetical protein LEP1GSC192_0465 [Leptospira sp. B5-022]